MFRDFSEGTAGLGISSGAVVLLYIHRACLLAIKKRRDSVSDVDPSWQLQSYIMGASMCTSKMLSVHEQLRTARVLEFRPPLDIDVSS